jgi:TolB-like protein/Tfp pilus assembly protein PilF
VNPRNFLGELKRRNVYKVAVVYAIVGWLVMQIAATVVPALHLSDAITSAVVLLVILGFPIALILAWAFELTPEGIKRTDAIEPGRRSPNRAWIYVVIVAGAISVGVFFLGRYTSSKQSAELPSKSIAVLPFENLSEDKANAYFADGIQEEILTRLAKIADLKVISRTSTQQYQSKPANLSEIAKQLGVANILEGSVQKAGDSVRVSVKLIQAASDSHLWADTYDRKLTDIFGVESEIAKAIAEQLQAKLSGREKQELADKPTTNPAAYDAYLRGLALARRSRITSPNLFGAAKALVEAVKLDPDFAPAWAELARVDAAIYRNEIDTSSARRDEARHAAETALRLRPDAGESLLAQGYYHYLVLRDYEAAKVTFDQARQRLPGSGEVPLALAYIARRQGFWDDSLVHFEDASRLDPRNLQLLSYWADTYETMRRFPDALKLLDRALTISPGDVDVIADKAEVYQRMGDLDSAGKLLAGLHADPGSLLATIQFIQWWLQRRYADAVKLQQNLLLKADQSLGVQQNSEYRLRLGDAQQRAGDAANAEASYLQALGELTTFQKEQPDNSRTAFLLSRVYAGLGRKEEALEQAERAVRLLPSSRDALEGSRREINLALVEAQVGEHDRAIAAVQRLLTVPSGLTPELLRIDPSWDSLRDDPRFQKLCQEKQP